MKNFIQVGDVLDVLLTADTVSGDVVVSGDFAGVASTSALSGDTIAVAVTGVYALPKAAGAGITAGKRLHWDSTAKTVTTTATGNVQVGYAVAAAASDAATVNVKLVQG